MPQYFRVSGIDGDRIGSFFGSVRRWGITLMVVLFLLLIIGPMLSFFFTVRYGEGAVVNRFGKIDRVVYPGLHFKIPMIEGVDRYTTQKLIYETSEFPEQGNADYRDTPVDTSTEDGQQVSIRYTVRFRLEPTKLQWIAENLGVEPQIVERIVKAESRSVVRNIARQFKAEDLYAGKVFSFQDRVAEMLRESFAENGLELDEFLVRQVTFGQQYVSTVEQKQIEKEKVKTAEYIAEQEKFRKQQMITQAEGQSRAQEILRQTIDPLVLQKMAIEKWDGKLPLYLGKDVTPFINLK